MTAINFSMQEMAYAYGEPTLRGVIRSQSEDFQVDENLGFELSGEGEHVCLHIQKRNANTADVAKSIAKLAGVKNMDVSYAGLKDRYAVTTQWFSVYLSNKAEPDWSSLESDDIRVLSVNRHNRKLRRGTLKGNRFRLIVRELNGVSSDLEHRLEQIKQNGVPNYFGEQRFGHSNLERAAAMFEGQKIRDRNKRSIYLSAARSAIFNSVLSKRVKQGTWNCALTGDMMMLNGSHSVFLAEVVDDVIAQRVKDQDIFPTGPLWGEGLAPTLGEVAQIETEVATDFSLFVKGLEKARMKQERRCLVLLPEEFCWEKTEEGLVLKFYLSSGAYATSILREILKH